MKLFCASCGTGNELDGVNCQSCGEKLVRPSGQPVKAEIVDDEPASGFSSNVAMNLAMAVVCLIYIVNPTAGILELIPDVLPIVGNIDEATATAGLLYALSNLGWIPWMRKK